jgi:hypothetical protein
LELYFITCINTQITFCKYPIGGFILVVYRPGEEHRLKVLERRELRKIFWCKRDEAGGDRRKMNKEELHGLYCSPNMFIVWVIT